MSKLPLICPGFFIAWSIASLMAFPVSASELNEYCVVSVLNRTVQVKSDGTWVLPNIPANFGPVRARATCVQNGETRSGQSDFFTIPANGSVDLPQILLGPVTPIPNQITVSANATTLTQQGQTVQLLVAGTYADGSINDLSKSSTGTQYLLSNTQIATISPDGLITAAQSGTVLVQAVNEGSQGLLQLSVALSADTDGDGILDDIEIREGLDPNNPADALDDADRDGLTNLEELQRGSDLHKADTDGDGLLDGDEIKIGTNPLLKDTDGDGVPDNIEVATGSNPLNAASYDLAKALKRISASPTAFVINVNSIDLVAYQKLQVIGEFTLGGTINLTAKTKGTNYASSDLSVCNFGAEDGRVYAGNDGTCTITVSNNGFTASTTGTVKTFTPKALSYVAIPGFANNVEVSGNYAYVASGSTGMQVVDVSNKATPKVVASLDSPGNGNDIAVVGNFAYLADDAFGLRIVDITDPLTPVLAGAVDTPGKAWSVKVSGGHAFVADGTGGLQIVDVVNPSAPSVVGSIALPGTAKGVDVDLERNLAVIAAGTNGIHIVNIQNINTPNLRATVAGGDVRDVAIAGNYAFLADLSRSFTVLDITNPGQPTLGLSTNLNLGGRLQDVVVSGNFALGADVLFVNGVPIIDISLPGSPQPRAILNFSSYRDDNGTGIAVDASHVYLTAERNISENGVIGDTRLYIGQYRAIEDKAGIPPTVSILSPADGSTAIQGQQVTISAQAADDVAVAAVIFNVNGEDIFTDTTEPYEASYTVPSNAVNLTISADAIDLGGNISSSSSINLTAIPDPLTTLSGRIVLKSTLEPVTNATVTCLGRTGTSGTDGTFVIPQVPTIQGNITCNALIIVNGKTFRGFSTPMVPVPAGFTTFGDIQIKEGSRILLLSDAATSGTTALKDALIANGNEVFLRDPPEFTWNGTNPALDGFGCVVHLDGATYSQALPLSGQQALVNFVKGGGGYITSQWMGFERNQGITTGMNDLILQSWNTNGSENCGGCNPTYSKVGAQADHPILSGIPDSFSFYADGHDAATLYSVSGAQPIVLMTVSSGNPAVIIREVDAGRTVQFSHAANYSGVGQTLLNVNIQKLYVNAVSWACK